MSIKSSIKKIIGETRINWIRGTIRRIKENHLHYSHIVLNNNMYDYTIFELKKRNVFNGYYDIEPLDLSGNKLLVQSTKKNANPLKDNSEIGIINVNTNKYEKVSVTSAWCWQQGSRLRWSKINEDVIYYNDILDEKYCTVSYDIKKKEKINVISAALYDIDNKETYGISLDFSRLQRLRPGYGYGRLKEETPFEKAPKDSGVYKVDLKSGVKELLISLDELSKITDVNNKYEHYINHVSISPSGNKFMFFHIRKVDIRPGWKVNLCVMNSDGTGFISFGEEHSASHYTWINDDKILVTGTDKNLFLTYRIYDLNDKTKVIVNETELNQDGHPTCISKNCFITDTYPNDKCMQKVFIHNITEKMSFDIVKLYSDPRLIGEQRCDLHPKICNRNGEMYIFVDSTYKKGKRSIVMMKMHESNIVKYIFRCKEL